MGVNCCVEFLFGESTNNALLNVQKVTSDSKKKGLV